MQPVAKTFKSDPAVKFNLFNIDAVVHGDGNLLIFMQKLAG